MMQKILDRAVDRHGSGYLVLNVIIGVIVTLVVLTVSILLMTLYVEISHAVVIRLLLVTVALSLVHMVHAFRKANFPVEPIKAWLDGDRSTGQTVEAWRTAVALPFAALRAILQSVVTVALPFTVLAHFELDLGLLETGGLFLGACVVVAYMAILRYFGIETMMRPVVKKIAGELPGELRGGPPVMSLRWKLLAGLPLINVITGVVVAGLTTEGKQGLMGMGLDVLIAVAVAFTISLELTLLLSKSILLPVRDLLKGVKRVSRGDFKVKVPVTTNDEIGELTRGFNEMVHGLRERDQLREALGSYVDPDIAERILDEGELLAGDDVEATVVFFDLRNFTGLVEEFRPDQVVALLNRVFERVVPILNIHGGHAINFAGDGIMALFGAPERHADHADRALAASLELVSAVERGLDDNLRVGIGINSGRVLVGSVGGGGRLEFTAIGDTVNVASRVERLTRRTGDTILLTEATYELLSSTEGIEARKPAILRGRTEEVSLYAPGDEMLGEAARRSLVAPIGSDGESEALPRRRRGGRSRPVGRGRRARMGKQGSS